MYSIISNVYENTYKQRKNKGKRANSEARENCHNA